MKLKPCDWSKIVFKKHIADLPKNIKTSSTKGVVHTLPLQCSGKSINLRELSNSERENIAFLTSAPFARRYPNLTIFNKHFRLTQFGASKLEICTSHLHQLSPLLKQLGCFCENYHKPWEGQFRNNPTPILTQLTEADLSILNRAFEYTKYKIKFRKSVLPFFFSNCLGKIRGFSPYNQIVEENGTNKMKSGQLKLEIEENPSVPTTR